MLLEIYVTYSVLKFMYLNTHDADEFWHFVQDVLMNDYMWAENVICGSGHVERKHYTYMFNFAWTIEDNYQMLDIWGAEQDDDYMLVWRNEDGSINDYRDKLYRLMDYGVSYEKIQSHTLGGTPKISKFVTKGSC